MWTTWKIWQYYWFLCTFNSSFESSLRKWMDTHSGLDLRRSRQEELFLSSVSQYEELHVFLLDLVDKSGLEGNIGSRMSPNPLLTDWQPAGDNSTEWRTVRETESQKNPKVNNVFISPTHLLHRRFAKRALIKMDSKVDSFGIAPVF